MIIRISPGDDVNDSRPISKWTKKAMLEAVEHMMSKEDAEKLARMSLEDLRSQLLVRDGDYLTGSATIPGAFRTTAYWRIDWAYVRELLEGFE